MKSKIKKLWSGFVAELKVGSARALLALSMLLALPAFLYSIIGTLVFGLYIEGFYDIPLVIKLLLIPSGIVFAYLGIMSFIGLGKWLYKAVTKKKSK